MATIRFTVNGTARSVDTEPERPLLEVLREDLGLTGTKYGCGEAQCGAALTGVTQEKIALLSRSTVQAPHSPSPQPYFVPVNPRSSRSTSNR